MCLCNCRASPLRATCNSELPPGGQVDVERSGGDALPERLALEQLHRDEVTPVVLVDIVYDAYVQVIQRGCGAGLAAEPLKRPPVPAKLLRQELRATRRPSFVSWAL